MTKVIQLQLSEQELAVIAAALPILSAVIDKDREAFTTAIQLLMQAMMFDEFDDYSIASLAEKVMLALDPTGELSK